MNTQTDTLTEREAALAAATSIQAGEARGWREFLLIARPFIANLAKRNCQSNDCDWEDFAADLEVRIFELLPKENLWDGWDYKLFISNRPIDKAREKRKAWVYALGITQRELRGLSAEQVSESAALIANSDLAVESEMVGIPAEIDGWDDWNITLDFLTPEQRYLVINSLELGKTAPVVEVEANVTHITALSVAAKNLGIHRDRARREFAKALDLIAIHYYGFTPLTLLMARWGVESEAILEAARASYAAELAAEAVAA